MREHSRLSPPDDRIIRGERLECSLISSSDCRWIAATANKEHIGAASLHPLARNTPNITAHDYQGRKVILHFVTLAERAFNHKAFGLVQLLRPSDCGRAHLTTAMNVVLLKGQLLDDAALRAHSHVLCRR